jgi:ABC-type xylose transport system permease subunit
VTASQGRRRPLGRNVIGAIIRGAPTSGLILRAVDAPDQEIIKGGVSIAAAIADRRRQRKRRAARPSGPSR